MPDLGRSGGEQSETATGISPSSAAPRSRWTTPGAVIGDRLIVEGFLGAGGMGCVVLARHRDLGELRAVKLLQPDRAASQEARWRLVREARAAARIQSAHVARVFDVVSEGPAAPYLVMEYLEGETLAARLKRQPLPVDQVASVVVQACEALAEAHLAGTIHRDLKPSNLFLTSVAGRGTFVKVLDFGIAKTIESRVDDWTRSHSLLASPAYASPEQLRASRDVDARADIWSLGVILYESFTGQLPFAGETLADLSTRILRDQPAPIRNHRPDAPPDFERIVERCLEKDPHARFPDVASLVRALSSFAPAESAECLARIQTLPARESLPPVEASATSDQPWLEQSTLTQASFAGQRVRRSSSMTPWRRRVGAVAALVVAGGAVLTLVFAGVRRPAAVLIGAEAAAAPAPPRSTSARAPVTATPPAAVASTPIAAPAVSPEARKPRVLRRPARPPAGPGVNRGAPATLEELPLDNLLDERR